jgi:hypothetical protein
MPNAREFRAYAQECEQLAKKIPAHAGALHKIAAAWRQCAEEAEKKEHPAKEQKNTQPKNKWTEDSGEVAPRPRARPKLSNASVR